LAGDAEFSTQLADIRFRLAHRRHCEPHFGWCHCERPPPGPAPRSRRGESSPRAFRDEFPFEFGKGGKDAKDELARRGGGVDRRSLPRQHFEPDTACGEVVDGVDEMVEVTAEAVEFPHDQGVALADCFKTSREAGSVILLPGRVVIVELIRVDAGFEQRIAL